MKRVDSHAHVFEPGLKLANVRRYAPEYKASIEDFVDHFTEKNLDIGVLIQPSFLGTDNSYMIEAIDKYPSKLYGVAVIDPKTITFEELEEMHRHNIIGIRLNLYGVELPDLTSEEWNRCIGYIKQLNWHIELHYDAILLQPILELLLKHDVKIVIDHFGKPDKDDPLSDEGFKYLLTLGKTKRVWVKVSACYRLGGLDNGKAVVKKMIPELIEAFGSEYLLWGSDWPHTQYESEITYEKMWSVFLDSIPEKHRDNILAKSFENLLP